MFKDFKVKDIFTLVSGKQPVKKDRFSEPDDGLVPAITGVTVNNGYGFYTTKKGKKTYKNILTISKDGEYAGTVYLQDKEVYLAGHSMGLIPKMSIDNVCLIYIASLFVNYLRLGYWKINAQIPSVTDEKMDGVFISLPVIKNPNPDHEYTVDDIDWQYMRDRITELERDRITVLDAYLQATGLNNYELTEDDKKILSLSAKRASDEDETLDDNSEDEVRFGSFKLEQLFESQTGDVDLQQKDVNDKGYFFINSGVTNRGIKGKTDRPAKVFKASTITIDFLGNAYYRDFDYVMATHNHVFSLSGDVIKNEKVGHYIIGKLSKLPQLFSYSNMATWNKLKVLDISLPIKSDAPDDYTTDDIDFDYMERYIRAMEKVVIADVVKYKNKVIETTKKVVGD